MESTLSRVRHIYSKFCKRSICGSFTNPEHQQPQKGLVKKHVRTQRKEKPIKHCMSAKLTGKPKVSKVNPVSPPFLDRFNNICQQGSLYDMMTVFLGFKDLFISESLSWLFLCLQEGSRTKFLLEVIKYYRKEAITSIWGSISMPTFQTLKQFSNFSNQFN